MFRMIGSPLGSKIAARTITHETIAHARTYLLNSRVNHWHHLTAKISCQSCRLLLKYLATRSMGEDMHF